MKFTIGDVVRKLREARGLTIRQFAKEAGIAVGALSKLENDGENSEQRTVYKAARALGITVADLYALAEPGGFTADEREWVKLLGELKAPADRESALAWARVLLEKQKERELAHGATASANPSKTGTRDDQ